MTVSITMDFTYLYLCLSLILLWGIIKYDAKFSKENLVGSFIALTNKMNLFFLFLLFGFSFIFSLVSISTSKVVLFVGESLLLIIYFSFFNYSIFYLIFFIQYIKQFSKENELLDFKLKEDIKK